MAYVDLSEPPKSVGSSKVDFIIKNSTSGDVILIMSSGDFGGIHQKILEGL